MRRDILLPLILTALAAGLAAAPARAVDMPSAASGAEGGKGGGRGGQDTGRGGQDGTPVPEPTSIILFGAGAAGFMLARRRRKAIG